MTSRERRMVVVLGVFGLIGTAAAAYGLILAPIEDQRAAARRLEDELTAKEADRDKLYKELARAEVAKRRSLPADPDTARVEYDAMMRRLLRAAHVPAGFTVAPKDSQDAKSIPLLDPKSKTPAYTKIGFEIRMKKVDLGMLAEFLQSYYRLDLLHQITRLEIARKDQDGSGSRFTGGGGDRADLEVTLITEAIILDGAESRRTLLPVPLGIGAAGGAAGYEAVVLSPEAGRGITPLQLATVLAPTTPPRDYTLLTAKDVFHGPLPTAVVAEKPKEDLSPYIKLTGITRRSDGSAMADVRDLANNIDYQIDLKPKGERYEVKVQKFYYIQDRRKKLDSWSELVISEEGTTTNRKFKVVGVDADELVLTEAASGAPGDKPRGGRPRSGERTRGKTPPPAPGAAPADGAGGAATHPGERVFVWRVGQALKGVRELDEKEADAALRRAAPAPPSAAAADPPQPTSPVSKAD